MTASSSSASNSADRDRRQEGLDLQRHCRGDLGHDLLSQCTKFERHFDARLGAFGRGRHATGIPSPCMTRQGRLCLHSADMPGRAREESGSGGRLCRSRMHQHGNGAHFVEHGQV